ncbi:MAG TPA: S1 RNA-binding domain-containing protein [Candidatus Limnocylindrales bacterium]|nr:S1 RNA-binding domain-containing protein [Candidatus Limnocylindrales bacterium]
MPLNADDEDDLDIAQRNEMFQYYEDSLRSIGEGEIVRGTVLSIDDKDVLVDVGFKSEGIIALSEFSDPTSIKVGDVIDVFLEKMENQDGLVVLSKQRADFVRVWDRVKEAHDLGQVVEGRLVRKIKGGVVVDLYGVEAFLPGSQIALRQVQNVDSLLGQSVSVKIIKLNKRRRNIVVSRRAVLEEERDRMKSTILKDLAKDQIREGQVKNITDYGAFVDLGGIDGLLHITDMSWTKRVAHPSEVLKKGDSVEVVILSIDKEHRRISLGLKQVSEDPWPLLADKFPAGMELKGTINRLFDRGAIVDLGEGIEGFVPLSQIGIDDLKRPNDAFEVGEELTMKVTRVDVPNHRLILSVKAWLTEQDDIALAEWTSKRNQVRARIAANPPVEEPVAPVKSGRKESTEDEE